MGGTYSTGSSLISTVVRLELRSVKLDSVLIFRGGGAKKLRGEAMVGEVGSSLILTIGNFSSRNFGGYSTRGFFMGDSSTLSGVLQLCSVFTGVGGVMGRIRAVLNTMSSIIGVISFKLESPSSVGVRFSSHQTLSFRTMLWLWFTEK